MIEIIYEDNHLIVVNKPAGILSQGDKSGQISLLEKTKQDLKKKYNKPGNVFLGLVHRLDKVVSGVMIFAKTSKAASRLSQEFREKKTTKIYLALVPGDDKIKKSNDWIELNQHLLRKNNFSKIIDSPQKGSQEVALKYKELISNQKYSLLMIQLLTGRKHQIRTQLSSVGLPIIGDKKYGSGEVLGPSQILLHAYALSLTHPTKKNRINFYSEPPEIFSKKIGFSMKDLEEIL